MAQGVGNLSIGIGQGSAQVFNPSPAIAQYGQILAQKQAKRDKENDQLAKDLAQGYDPNSLRNEQDRTKYIKTYTDEIKPLGIAAENEKDPIKRANMMAEVRQKLTDLGAYAEGSKKQALIERQVATLIREHPHMFSDDAVKQVQDGLQKEWNDKSVFKSPLDLARGIDPEKVFASYEKLKKPILEQAQFDNGVKGKPYTLAGKTYQDLNKKAGIPINGDNGALEHVLAWASSDDDAKLYLQQAYPDIKGNNEQSTLALRALKFMHDQGDDQGFYKYKQERGEAYKPQEPVRYSKLQLYNLNKYGDPNGPAKADANSPTYVQDLSAKARDPQTQMDAYQQLNDIVASNPAYQHGIHISRNDDGTVDVTVPAKMKYKAATATEDAGRYIEKPAYTVKLDPKNQALHDTKFGEIFKDVTGDVSGAPSHILTPAGKGHVGAGHEQQAQNTRTITDSKGNSITAYPKNGKWYNAQTNKPIE